MRKVGILDFQLRQRVCKVARRRAWAGSHSGATFYFGALHLIRAIQRDRGGRRAQVTHFRSAWHGDEPDQIGVI